MIFFKAPVEPSQPEETLSEILDYAIREAVGKETLTDAMICPMIADLKLDVWVTSYCNVYFYRAQVRKLTCIDLNFYCHNSSMNNYPHNHASCCFT